MQDHEIRKLRRLTTFEALVDYLRYELDWPIEVEDAEDIVFEYEPEELGLDPQYAVKIESIKQVRPLAEGQPARGVLHDFDGPDAVGRIVFGLAGAPGPARVGAHAGEVAVDRGGLKTALDEQMLTVGFHVEGRDAGRGEIAAGGIPVPRGEIRHGALVGAHGGRRAILLLEPLGERFDSILGHFLSPLTP